VTVRRDTPPPEELPGVYRRGPAATRSEFDVLTCDVARCMGAQSVLLFACEGTALTRVVSAWGTSERDRIAGTQVLQRAFAGGVLRRGRGAAGRLEPRADTPGRDGRGDITHAIAAPVATLRGPRGVLLAGYSGGLPTDRERQLWVIERYCGLAALCMHDHDVLGGLLTSASRDPLTGCLNYAGTLRVLDAEIKRSMRYAFDVSCAFIDLDGLDAVSDRHGHLHADAVLVAAAAAMRAGVRASDTVGRYGGDEFVAIFPQTREADALRLARRLQTRIRTATLALRSEPIDASIGVAQWKDPESVEQLLRHADGALLAARRARGAVIAARDLAPAED
jgi:diguanylate cyclase (GGDEF)-like protein